MPATTRAAVGLSTLTIGALSIPFPPAHVRIARRDGQVFIQLYTEDPAGAGVDDKNESNGYYFDMAIDIDDPSALPGKTWLYTGRSNERAESLNSIILAGDADTPSKQLQPVDCRIDFENASDPMTLRVSGKFNVFVGPSTFTASEVISVSATITARVDATN